MYPSRFLGGLLVALALTISTGAAKAADPVKSMLVILTSPETETQAMALVLANQAAKAGTPVNLLLCGPAGDIALRTPPDAAGKVVTPKGMTVLSLLGALKAKGGKVDVCAIFLPNRKLGAEALAGGIGIAKPPVIAAEMTAPGTRLATF
ncbi:MAG TPA: hypothetical protein DCG48_04370 [Rhodospirillaceae bacterium]|nr:hypothetical protein [Rhodospirillaceae bacterium]